MNATVSVSQSTAQPRLLDALSSRDRMLLASDLLPPCDFVAMIIAALVSSAVYSLLHASTSALSLTGSTWTNLSNVALIGAALATFLLYDRQFAKHAIGERIALLARSFVFRFAVTTLLIAILGNATNLLDSVPTAWLTLWLVSGFALTATTRWLAARSVHRLQFRGALTESIAVVGAGPIADGLDRHLRQTRARNIELVGVFDDVTLGANVAGSSAWPVHNLDRLIEISKTRQLDWIVITIPDSDEARIRAVLEKLQPLSIPIALCPQHLGLRTAPKDIDFVGGGLPVALLADRPIKRWNAIIKSVEDILLTWFIALLLLPVFALIALAIRLDSPGPIVFKQRRHTFNNTEFNIYKFRTMRWQPQKSGQLQQTQRNDQRITRVGRFLRETSLDELPQIFNVLRGEMSLIGPRPHAVNMRTEDRLGWEITDRYAHRHRVKPGMTGWSQVNGARGATDTIAQLQRRIDLDLYYVDHWSLALDIKILLMTIKVVMQRTNAF